MDTKKSDKKTVIIVGAVLLLLVLLIVSGVFLLRDKQDPEPTLEEIVDSKLNAYQTDLADSMDSLKTSRDAAQYLLTWGKNKGISSSIDSHDNVTFTLKPTDDTYKDRAPVVFVCEYDVTNLPASLEPIASALTIAKNTAQHGKVQLIFSPANRHGQPQCIRALCLRISPMRRSFLPRQVCIVQDLTGNRRLSEIPPFG